MMTGTPKRELGTSKRVLWYFGILRHFIRVCTFSLGNFDLQRKNIICGPLIYAKDHPDLSVSNFMKLSIGPKRVNIITPSLNIRVGSHVVFV